MAKAIESNGRRAIAIQADASDAKAVKAAVDKTVATFGRLDVLVNNAGTAIPKTFEETVSQRELAAPIFKQSSCLNPRESSI